MVLTRNDSSDDDESVDSSEASSSAQDDETSQRKIAAEVGDDELLDVDALELMSDVDSQGSD